VSSGYLRKNHARPIA